MGECRGCSPLPGDLGVPPILKISSGGRVGKRPIPELPTMKRLSWQIPLDGRVKSVPAHLRPRRNGVVKRSLAPACESSVGDGGWLIGVPGLEEHPLASDLRVY